MISPTITPAECLTKEPAGLSDRERLVRREIAAIVGQALAVAAANGYVVQVCYSEGYFFMEPKPVKHGGT